MEGMPWFTPGGGRDERYFAGNSDVSDYGPPLGDIPEFSGQLGQWQVSLRFLRGLMS